MQTILLFSNIAPHYRAPLWLRLLNQPSWEMHIYYGFNSRLNIHSIDFNKPEFAQYQNRLHHLKNYWLKGKFLIWQKGVIRHCLFSKFNQVIFLGDMYCLSTWLAAIICRFRGNQIIFWSHGIYGNEGKIKLIFRKLFYRLAHKFLLYERRAKNLMVQHDFNPDKLYVVFNSLDYDTHKALRLKFEVLLKFDVFSFLSDSSMPVIIFIGR